MTIPDESITFAEAMALDPSEVETRRFEAGDWVQLSTTLGHTLAFLRASEFRRARPKRSRIEEMAETNFCAANAGRSNKFFEAERVEHYVEAIRAVCEYLAERVYATRTTPRQPMDGGEVARDVERHFLEPR